MEFVRNIAKSLMLGILGLLLYFVLPIVGAMVIFTLIAQLVIVIYERHVSKKRKRCEYTEIVTEQN